MKKKTGHLLNALLIFSVIFLPLGLISGAKTSGPEIDNEEALRIPESGSSAELLNYAKDLLSKERDFSSEVEFRSWMKRMFATVLTVADRIIAHPDQDHFYFSACGMKGQVLAHLAMSQPDQLSRFEEFVLFLEKDQKIQGNAQGREMVRIFRGILYQGKVAAWTANAPKREEMDSLLKEIRAFVLANPSMGDLVFDLVYPITIVADQEKKPEWTAELIGEFYTAFKNSNQPELQKTAAGLEGTLRFTSLKGKEILLEGILSDEKTFDPALLQGKVVVLAFWASWCDPYKAIYPELFVLYHKYHEKGLEYVGYNIDKDPVPMRKFISDQKIPWCNIALSLSVQKGFKDLSEYYGIRDIPTIILIGRDGKVLSASLDIDTLKKTVEDIFKQ
ncbi:MAG: TlpA disulfide reductase family protein [Planctomycetia bacterium]|nr:TlpA disulfide reductase family protein [Planctomycetia bacterium]